MSEEAKEAQAGKLKGPWNSLEAAKVASAILVPVLVVAIGFWLNSNLSNQVKQIDRDDRQEQRSDEFRTRLLKKRSDLWEQVQVPIQDIDAIQASILQVAYAKTSANRRDKTLPENTTPIHLAKVKRIMEPFLSCFSGEFQSMFHDYVEQVHSNQILIEKYADPARYRPVSHEELNREISAAGSLYNDMSRLIAVEVAPKGSVTIDPNDTCAV